MGWLLLLGATALLVLYPLAMLVVGSFSDAPLGEPGRFTLANYVAVLTNWTFGAVFLNTLWVAIFSTTLAMISGFGLAWLVVRTDIPFRRTVQLFAMLPFLIPGALSAIGWAVLGNPDIGLLNVGWKALTGASWPIINVYSYAGIGFVLAQHAAGFFYLMIVSPLRNLDPSYREAARIAGARPGYVFRAVELPLLIPALFPLAVLVFVRAIETFEVPAILGTPANVFLVTNDIYYRLKIYTPPQYGTAIAISVMITAVMAGLLIVQGWVTSRRSRVSLTGKGFRQQRLRLGRWKPLCLVLVILYALATSILPLGVIVLSSFFKFFGLYDLSMLTLDNYRILTDDHVRRALANTALLIVVCATAAILLGAFVAYALHHRIVPGKGFFEAVVLTPWAMPGLVFGLAMLWAYIWVPGFYGSLKVLAVAYITFGIAIGVRSMRAVFEQMSSDLEESASVHGATLWQTLRLIVFPLVRPGLIAGWFVLAAILSRELAASVMLYGSGSEVVSVLLLGFWEQGRGNYVTVLSVVMMSGLIVLYILESIVAGRQASAVAHTPAQRT